MRRTGARLDCRALQLVSPADSPCGAIVVSATLRLLYYTAGTEQLPDCPDNIGQIKVALYLYQVFKWRRGHMTLLCANLAAVLYLLGGRTLENACALARSLPQRLDLGVFLALQ